MFVGRVREAYETAKPIEMPFGMLRLSLVDPRNYVSDGGAHSLRGRSKFGGSDSPLQSIGLP